MSRWGKAAGFALILLFFCLGTWRIGRSFLAGWHDLRGSAIERSQRWTRAIAEYRQAVRLEGGRVEYRLRLADAMARRGRYGLDKEAWLAEAIGEYRRAIALDPRCAPCYLGLGMAAERLAQARLFAPPISPRSPASLLPSPPAPLPPRSPAPLGCYRKAVSLDTHNAHYRAVLVDFHLRHGRLRAGQRRHEEARAVYQEGANRTGDPGLAQEAQALQGKGR